MAEITSTGTRPGTPLTAPQATTTTPPSRRLSWLLLLGLLLIAAQLLWLLRPLWLAHPGVRQVLTPVVTALGSSLERPVLRDVWQTSRVDLVADAATPGVWQVSAVLMHSARILQPWPVLELQMKNEAGDIVGSRQLMPSDYLPASGAVDLLEGEQPVQIQVGIRQRAAADGSYPAFASAALTPLP